MDEFGPWWREAEHPLSLRRRRSSISYLQLPYFSDTVCDLGGASELANYGEYSGDPSETQTYEYAKTILSMMTEGAPHPKGKVLIIGGSIANFTNVAMTFKVSWSFDSIHILQGIVRAFEKLREKLVEHRVTIYVRRGGPNYQEGLRTIKEIGIIWSILA